ncbi:MAG: hypothetical protein PGN07_01735 [Aeromicrobium erythreum]
MTAPAPAVTPTREHGPTTVATWCVQIFAVADAAAARGAGTELLDLLDAGCSVQVSASGPDHFVVVETADDPVLLDLVAATVGAHADHAELVHRSAGPVAPFAGTR